MLGEIVGAIGGLIGANKSKSDAKEAFERNARLQKEFAQNSLQWKIADAQKAGVHPLAALGAQTYSASPISIGGPDWSSVGQSVGRAVSAGMDTTERTVAKLAVEKAGLENEYLRAQIASVRTRIAQHSQPAVPGNQQYVLDGQGETAIPAIDKITNPQRTPYTRTPAGTVIANTPGSDAQVYEDRYGDVAQEVYGLNNLYWDRGRRALMTYDGPATRAAIWNELQKIIRGRD